MGLRYLCHIFLRFLIKIQNTCEISAIKIDERDINSKNIFIDTLSLFTQKYSHEQTQISYEDL